MASTKYLPVVAWQQYVVSGFQSFVLVLQVTNIMFATFMVECALFL